MNDSIFVGLDVPKATISVAVAEGTRGGEVRSWGIIPNRTDQIAKLAEKLTRANGERVLLRSWPLWLRPASATDGIGS